MTQVDAQKTISNACSPDNTGDAGNSGSVATIVFVTYNSGQLLNAMLQNLQGYPVLVYDNASSDDTVLELQKNYPQVRLHSNSINSGYGRAANNAFKLIDTPYALLINPDVDIQGDQIDALIATANRLDDNWLFVAPDTSPVIFSRGRPV